MLRCWVWCINVILYGVLLVWCQFRQFNIGLGLFGIMVFSVFCGLLRIVQCVMFLGSSVSVFLGVWMIVMFICFIYQLLGVLGIMCQQLNGWWKIIVGCLFGVYISQLLGILVSGSQVLKFGLIVYGQLWLLNVWQCWVLLGIIRWLKLLCVSVLFVCWYSMLMWWEYRVLRFGWFIMGVCLIVWSVVFDFVVIVLVVLCWNWYLYC